MSYPKIGSAIVPVDHDELRIIFDVHGENTINVGHLQQDHSIGAYINVDDMVRKHFAIFGSTGAGKSSARRADPARDHGCAARSAHAADRSA